MQAVRILAAAGSFIGSWSTTGHFIDSTCRYVTVTCRVIEVLNEFKC
jgi:hypothetical protein